MLILIGVAFYVLPVLLFLYSFATQFSDGEEEEDSDSDSDGRLL